ncbi:uncharacterized protein B4U79_02789 [Dinothrombium tinctorium]|uniref:Integrase catalytic domain-containing protein n=1 Tax=Dinothrombium tinctorium TaxID=1965070 RepID=A0A3S3RVN3_9ACAR|nr:uncharacterized protein B4U79_02789 [Dinothrombium tinctorium]
MSKLEILDKIYYDPRNPASFSSAKKLFCAARNISPSITFHDVNQWLSTQPTYTLHKTGRKRFERNKIIVNGIDEQWQADLADLTSFSSLNKGFKYLLCVIDVFSKFAWVIPIKNKKPVSITDKGKEFCNSTFKKFLEVEEGDEVRLKLNKSSFEKGFHPTWTSEIFKVKKTIPKYKKSVYRISDSKDEELIGTFYPEEIQKVTPPSILGAKEIVKRRIRRNTIEYLIKFANNRESWIPITQMTP